MLFFELYKIMVNKVTFVGFRGAIALMPPPGSAPEKTTLIRQKLFCERLGISGLHAGSNCFEIWFKRY